MPETPAFLAERLKAEGEKTVAHFGSLSAVQWGTEIYTEGTTWTVRNVFAHLVTSERAFVKLFAQIQQGGPGSAEDFSIDRYNASQQRRTQNMSPAELLEGFRAVRTEMAGWVAGLDPLDLERVGRHPYLGKTTLAEMIKMIYRHDQIHFRDVRKAFDAA
ncbi:MAG TPA: DinB family protein [Anaerolineales bacterium]|jgi:hypothetical protein